MLVQNDIPFNPDSKSRFWYNAIFGAYSGLALFTSLVHKDDAAFQANIKWVSAFYAMSFSFACIVYTRTILRGLLPKKMFKWVRNIVFWFIGFLTYGLFPLSFAVMNSSNEQVQAGI